MFMTHRARLLGTLLSVLALAFTVRADHGTRPHTPNLHTLGDSVHLATFADEPAQRHTNADLAFWGDIIFHGNYDGFRILKGSPGNPKEISWTRCNGDQGDIVVWGDILVRAWNAPAPPDDPGTPEPENRFCDGEPVPVGFEGMHIFDVSNLENPRLIGEVELSAVADRADSVGCGSHTLTLVPDLDDNRVLIYSHTSGGSSELPGPEQACDWIDIITIPLDDPAGAAFLRREPIQGGHAAHDSGVILGSVNMLAVASGHMSNVFDIGDNQWPGGSPEDPVFLYAIEEEGVCAVPGSELCNGNWHTASFTWDGEVIILSWEPGGGSEPECEATDPIVKKSMFFYDAKTGAKLGQWTLPRPQSAQENCTIHYYNVVPVKSRYVVVSGNYQAGTWVTDFTDPSNPLTIAWSDPPPLDLQTAQDGDLVDGIGGAWSSYWYNNFIYESEITKGLHVFRLSDAISGAAIQLHHLNPQTQEFSFH